MYKLVPFGISQITDDPVDADERKLIDPSELETVVLNP